MTPIQLIYSLSAQDLQAYPWLMRKHPYIEHTFPNGVFRTGFMRGSFGPDQYEPYARVALAHGALEVRIMDGDEQKLCYRWAQVPA